jgi:cell division septum initiation protein DivIVA
MEELNVQLKELQQLLQTLLKRYNTLQKENEHLKRSNMELNNNLLEKEKIIQSAQQKFVAGNIVLSYNPEEKKLLSQKIDLYLRDIEKCLSLLNA